LDVGNYCYVAVYSAALGAWAPTEGGEGRAYRGGRPAYSLFSYTVCTDYESDACKQDFLLKTNVKTKD